MNAMPTSLRGLAGGLALIAVANGAILAAVAWNRSEREAEVTLTERELRLDYRYLGADQEEDEDTGLALRFDWTPRWAFPDAHLPWLDRRKLAALGFDVGVAPDAPAAIEHYAKTLPRTALVVFEHDGASWRNWLAGEERKLAELRREVAAGRKTAKDLEVAESVLAANRTTRSRLFPIDAGRDAAALRARYPDRSRYLIFRGSLRLALEQPRGKPPFLTGWAAGLAVERLHVPRELRPVLDAVIREDRERQRALEERAARRDELIEEDVRGPDYRAVVAVGRRLEPWLVSVEGLPAPPPPATPGR
jgi:hypothetical protein